MNALSAAGNVHVYVPHGKNVPHLLGCLVSHHAHCLLARDRFVVDKYRLVSLDEDAVTIFAKARTRRLRNTAGAGAPPRSVGSGGSGGRHPAHRGVDADPARFRNQTPDGGAPNSRRAE